jgi:hypothetical protein
MTASVRTLLVVLAIVAAVFAVVAAERGAILLSAPAWLGVALGALASAHLP